jgi:hypothetical protein
MHPRCLQQVVEFAELQAKLGDRGTISTREADWPAAMARSSKSIASQLVPSLPDLFQSLLSAELQAKLDDRGTIGTREADWPAAVARSSTTCD